MILEGMHVDTVFHSYSFFLQHAAGAGVLHPQSCTWYWPHCGALSPAPALQRGPAVGHVRGAHVRVTQQESAAAQEVHQDCCSVRTHTDTDNFGIKDLTV